MRPGTGEAIRVSHTEATLDARGQFAALRTMLAGNEVDRLVDVLTDAYHARDGMVHDEVHEALLKDSAEELNRAEEEICEKDEENQKLRERVEELETTLKSILGVIKLAGAPP